ncbi:LysR family transcriptional regulator [Gorillibacterium timonense]|uniref:LysR family transcriptional regulator n=1 Tax=Gorillibacterium timonense TaxID=1689269 RepID=UPI00071C5258|nr:LysR family transcriptional regulator [Gorillibacterium timonense]
MALSFHMLHIFYTVAEKGTFSAAAQSLHMTQPGVTMQIQALEDHFGTKMFRRMPKAVELTDAGLALLPYARQMVELMAQTEREMSRFTRELGGRLELGTSLTIGEYILPRLIGPFNREFPHITVSMKVMNTAQIMEGVLAHSLTFGLVEAGIEHPDLVVEPLLHDELKLVLPAGHELLHQERITVDDLSRYPFIMRERGSGTRRIVEEALQRGGHSPSELRIAMDLGSTGAIKSAVEAGLGLSILSGSTVKHEVALGVLELREIEGIRFERSFSSVYHRTALLPLPAVTFMTFIRDKELSQWLT